MELFKIFLKEKHYPTETLTKEERVGVLNSLDFIRTNGGLVRMGTEHPLVCRLEGRRWNETPVRELEVKPFYVCRFKVTNEMFEVINSTHTRPPQAPNNDMPVVDITYGEALRFCKKVNLITGMNFRLLTEPEWVFAAAPYGWEFPYQENPNNPKLDWGHVYGDGIEQTVAPIKDPRWKPNFLGLDQMSHNVSEFTFGHYRISNETWGGQDDGMYCIVKGGNYGHCSYTPGVHRRMIVDVSDRNPRIGFRLAHSDI